MCAAGNGGTKTSSDVYNGRLALNPHRGRRIYLPYNTGRLSHSFWCWTSLKDIINVSVTYSNICIAAVVAACLYISPANLFAGYRCQVKKDTNSFLLMKMLMACSSVLELVLAKGNHTIKSVGSSSGNIGSSSNPRFSIVCSLDSFNESVLIKEFC